MAESERVGLEGGKQPNQRSFGASKAQLGMAVFLASLSMLFGACLMAMVLTRINGAAWPDAELTALPRGLLVSTVLMALVSASLHRAVAAARANRPRALLAALSLAVALAVLFVLAQSLNWWQMASRDLGAETATLYPFTFYFLTGLHATHVVGGLFPLWIIRAKARQTEYSSSRYEPVRLCAQYWHFLGIVWVILGVALYLMR
jgi:cytochrome c oxidase subunit 3